MRFSITCLALLTLAAAPAFPQSIWVGPVGGGMMAVQEAQTLWPKHVVFGIVEDNYDRDPLGIDVFEVRVDWRMGLSPRWDLYGRYHISRAVSVPGVHPVPSPPLDIVSLNTPPPRPPYRAMYWPMPYLTRHAGAGFTDMTPGEYRFGAKYLMAEQNKWRPAMSVNAEFSVPGDMSADALSRGSSSGSVDVHLNLASTWKWRRWSVSTNTGYTRNGVLKRSDLLITRNEEGDTMVTEETIRRPGFLHGGLGVRFHIWRGISAFTEAYGWTPVGLGTPMFDEAGASDVLGGIQISVKGVSFTAGVRQHLNPPQDHLVLATGPLAGALDLSSLSNATQQQYLSSVGIDPSSHRPGTSLVVTGVRQGVPDPKGSHRIPDTYLTHTTGNGAIIAALSFTF